MNEAEVDYIVAFIMGGLNGSFKDSKDRGLRTEQNHKKRVGEPVIIFDNLLPLSL